MDFIQIDRIVKDKSGTQKVKTEVLNISELHSFRPWHKGEYDTFEKEDVTLLVMKSSAKTTGQRDADDKKKDELPTMIIHESYDNFIQRMSGRVILMGNVQ